MNKNYQSVRIIKQFDLENGDTLVLADESIELEGGGRITYEPRNIYRFNRNGDIVWIIKSNNDWVGNSFNGMYIRDGEYLAHRWDSGLYKLDLENGIAIPFYLVR